MRSHRLIHESAECNVWEITWPPGTGLDWHHHGASEAHIFISSGTLTEWLRYSEEPYDQKVGTWWSVPNWQEHKVMNEGTEDVVSIHVYRPPLISDYPDQEIG